MLDILIKAVFFIIGKIGDIILAPIMLLVSALVPSITFNLSNITNFLTNSINYAIFFLKALMIPPECLGIVLLVFTSSVTLITGVRVYNFILKLYDNFKP